MKKRTHKKLLNVAGKITPLETLERTNALKIMKIEEDEKKNEEVKRDSTCSTKAKMLKMVAWYLVPTIYIIFSVTYFTIYCMI